MGVFDSLRCKYPLPIDGVNHLEFQSKDTPAQFQDDYEIREDGTLWHHEYDVEDHSDQNATGIMRIFESLACVNERWVPEIFTGEIGFYGLRDQKDYSSEVAFVAFFVKGKVTEILVTER